MNEEVLELHKKNTGVLSIHPDIQIIDSQDLAKAYTPGVAELSLLIEENHNLAREYTISGKLVAVITDGSAVLGLGNVGTQAGLPIVEGKALLYKALADVDAIPLAIEQKSVDEIVQTVANFNNSFGGIHLEDIAAPDCFEIEEKLQQQLSIPVYHDDQEGTAIVVLAGLINAAKVAKKPLNSVKVVMNGLGASGVATAKLLYQAGVEEITFVDRQGVLYKEDETLNKYQRQLVEKSSSNRQAKSLKEAVVNQDVFIGLSDGNLLTAEMVETMAENPIVFALANPVPEILPEEAKKGGASLIATGSSQYPNQVNNILVFPGLFKGLLDSKISQVTLELQERVAEQLASMIQNPTVDKFIPQVFDPGVVDVVSKAVTKKNKES